MPLAEVKQFVQLCLLGDATIPTRHQIIQNQVLKVEADLAAMEKRIHVLRRKATCARDECRRLRVVSKRFFRI